eukprot:2765111-Rhodomonas_salina.1
MLTLFSSLEFEFGRGNARGCICEFPVALSHTADASGLAWAHRVSQSEFGWGRNVAVNEAFACLDTDMNGSVLPRARAPT